MNFRNLIGLLALAGPVFGGTALAAELGKSRYIDTTDGVKIHCLETGSGRSLLFVPGWTMPCEIWEHQIKHFAKTHRVVAMDPRSQGKSSDPPDGHHPAARARDIRALVEELKLAPLVLVGWSTAVAEIASYVDQFGSDGIAGIVFVDGIVGADYDPVVTPAMLKYAALFQTERQAAAIRYVRSMFRKAQSEEFLTRISFASLKTPTNSAMALFFGAFAADNRAALAKIDKPTLIVVAGGEGLMPVYLDMQKRIQGSRLEIFQEAGHALFVDEPDRFNRLVGQFVMGR